MKFKNKLKIKSANARKWKHKEGGIVKADNGIKFTLNDGINLGLNLYSTAKYNNAIDNQIKALNPLKDYYKNSIISKKYKDNIMKGFAERQQLPNSGTVINSNPDIDKHFYYTQAVNDSQDELNEINRSLEQQKLNLQAQKKSILSSAANTALNYNNYDFG